MKKAMAIAISLVLMAPAGCALSPVSPQTLEQQKMPLTKLTKIMRGCFRRTNGVPENETSQQILERCVKQKDPQLFERMRPYTYKFEYREGQVLVLMCDPDGERALMEDLSCTPYIDGVYYNRTPAAPCQRQLNLEQICK